MPTFRRASYAACLLADPGLQEPIYLGECIQVSFVIPPNYFLPSRNPVPRKRYWRYLQCAQQASRTSRE